MIALQLRQKSGQSLSSQLAQQLRHGIHSGKIAPSEALPSVRELAGKLTVHPLTIAKAYAALEHEGLVSTVWGRGTFVAPRKGALDRESRLYVKGLVHRFIQETLPLVKDHLELRALIEQGLREHLARVG